MQAQGAGNWPAPFVGYIEDVFSTYLYTGTGANQTITNNINISAYGGLVWIKDRTTGYDHWLQTPSVGVNSAFNSNTTGYTTPVTDTITSFNTNGFSVGADSSYFAVNKSGDSYASWTFRKQAKFFDVVTYTGTGSARTIAHNLGSTPGCIMVKRLTTGYDWQVYHSGLTSPSYSIVLNSTAAQVIAPLVWNATAPTGSVFTVGSDINVNNFGQQYVAYLFASNAGGFGLTGTDNVITCGSFVKPGATYGPTVNLGYEPQWILVKSTTDVQNWIMYDNMRGLTVPPLSTFNGVTLFPNTSGVELNNGANLRPTATGFEVDGLIQGATYIYIAIRRGPMKVPTVGTSVFTTILQSPQSAGTLRTVGFTSDLIIGNVRVGSDHYFQDRLRGLPSTGTTQNTASLLSAVTSPESNSYPYLYNVWNTTARDGDLSYVSNGVGWNFQRAPGFFDEVCYNGSGVSTPTTVSHNLGVAPEMIIMFGRSYSAAGSLQGQVWTSTLTGNKTLYLFSNSGLPSWGDQAPYSVTATNFVSGFFSTPESTTNTFVAYLFATCPGVSKVGSYSGTGATQTINCGFTGGARFVLIKRTDSTGDWYVWDTARGMVSGTDPSLLLNTTAAEVNANSVYTTGVGFQIVSTGAGINASGGTYIFLAVA